MPKTLILDPRSVKQMLDNLSKISRKTATKHLRIGLNAWGGVVRDVARQHVRVETGLLKKSLGVKVVIPDASFNKAHHGKPAYVYVGPSRKSGRMMARTKKGTLRGLAVAQRELVSQRGFAKAIGAKPLARERIAVALALKAFPNAIYRNPTRYAHLVEKGTKRSKAYPFIEPAAKAGETAGLEKLATKLRQGLELEAAAVAK